MLHIGLDWMLLTLACIAADSIFQQTFKRLHELPALSTSSTPAADGVQTLWLEQKLDHFNASESRTWRMRYMINECHYQAGGPLFIFVGGAWEISPSHINGGHLYDMAREHNALLAYTEHRYYGKSQPLFDLSIESLQFLNAQQALADLAHFISSIKQQTAGLAAARVILVGGFYAGSLVAWFRRSYADLAAGGWASSAPLFAKLNFVDFKPIVGKSIEHIGGAKCYMHIEHGFEEIDDILAREHGAEFRVMFKLCRRFNVKSDLDLWTFFQHIASIFTGVLQDSVNGEIEIACRQILSRNNDLMGLSSYLLGKLGNETCHDVGYEDYLSDLLEPKYTNNGMRAWTYQLCNEFGWFQSSESRAQPFGRKFPLDFFVTLCRDVFGEKYTLEFMQYRVLQTNVDFGGLRPAVERVYFSHGQLDAWSAVGLRNDSHAAIIPGYARCMDLDSISDTDTAEMRRSKQHIAELVRVWLT